MAIDTTTSVDVQTLTPFKKFIMTIGALPTSYLESMTYAELLMWFCNYLQNTVIPTVNNNAEAVEELQGLYEQLKNYVNNYFDNLDVQDEINNKLDSMAQDGSLYNIIKTYTDPIVNQQNARITSVENELRSVANGSPLVASSVSGMTDTTRTYVNTTDGKWYYYDGDSWEIGGTYQSTGIGENDIQSFMLESKLQDMLFYSYTPLTGTTYTNTIMKKNGNTTSWNNAQYTIYDVSPNDMLFITSKWGESEYIACINLLYNSTYVSYVSGVDNPVLYKLIIPEGVNKLSLNNQFLASSQVLKVTGLTDRSTKEFITKMNNNLTEEYDTINLSNVATITDCFYGINTTNNVITTSSNANSKGYAIPVIENEKYKITAYAGGNAIEYAIVDENYHVLNYEKNGSFTQHEFSLTMPSGACWILFNDLSGTSKAGAKKLKELDLSNIDDAYSQEILMQRVSYENECRSQQIKNDFAWKSFDKAYITFTFDDLRDDIPSIVDLFISKGIKICLAAIPNRLPVILNGGETGQEVCERVVQSGGEILSHDSQVITSSSTDADYIRQFYTDKKTLVNAGFDINGIILAGGDNYNTADFDKCVYYMRPYFRYSDLYGTGTGVTQYYHPRTWISATEATNETNIQNAITNKTWLSFASHGTTEVSLELLETLLDYILTLSSDDVEVVTYLELFNKEGSSVLEQRIENLES